MDFYTLDDNFMPRKLIEPFVSAIWTERYSSAGDFQLVVLSPSIMATELARGRFLAMSGSKEIMQIETRSIEKNLLTVTGSSLVKFFNEREAIFPDLNYDPTDTSAKNYADYMDDTLQAGPFLTNVIVKTLIVPETYTDFYSGLNFNWKYEVIPGLRIGAVDDHGDVKTLTFPIGPIYDGIEKFAGEQRLGFKLYLESASAVSGAYDLAFYTYRGVNRTSNQNVHRLIRMSADMDSLLGEKQLLSWENYKNVIYVLYENELTLHYSHGYVPLGFKRRIARIDAPDTQIDDSEKNLAFRKQVAWNAFIKHHQIAIVDGEVTTISGHKFTKDYYLGDVIELESTDGLITPVQVVEHIRSQDQYGFKEYPSFNILDLALFDFNKDLGSGGVLGDTSDPIYITEPPPLPRLVFSYLPNPTLERVVGGLMPDGKLITIWTDAANGYQLVPQIWTPDHQKLVIHRLNQFFDSETFHNEARLSYWLIRSDGSDRQQLVEEVVGTGEASEGWDTSERAGLWSDSVGDDGHKYLYIAKRRGGSNATVARRVDIYQSTTFPVSDLNVFLNAEMFPENQMEEFPNLVPSPDGSKLYIRRPALNTSFNFEAHHSISNSDEPSLDAIDLGIDPVEFYLLLTWCADSTKLYTALDATSYISFDVASSIVSTYNIVQEGVLGAVYMSPNHSKIVWEETTYADGGESGERWLFVGNLDGSSASLLYHTPAYADSSDHRPEDANHDALQLHRTLAWSFDSTKVAVVDRRPQSPIWIIDVNTAVATKVYDGTGWDSILIDPTGGEDEGGGIIITLDEDYIPPPEIYDLMMFNA